MSPGSPYLPSKPRSVAPTSTDWPRGPVEAQDEVAAVEGVVRAVVRRVRARRRERPGPRVLCALGVDEPKTRVEAPRLDEISARGSPEPFWAWMETTPPTASLP